MKRTFLFTAAAMYFGVVLVGCTAATARNPEVQPLVFGIRDRLTPEGAHGLAYSGLSWDATGVRASWEVETALDWPGYSAWAKTRLPPDFKVVSEGDSWLALGKEMPGDYYSVRLTPVPSSKPLRIHADFEGHPH